MAPIRTAIEVDLAKPAKDQLGLHNRWHPEIPPAAHVEPGESVHLQCLDWTGGQISNNDTADDIRDVDLTHIHYLSGPVEVTTAEPGDVLVVDIIDVQPLPVQPWGFTGIFAKNNGGGFLDEFYPDAAKAIWDFEGIYASSRHVPHVRFPGLIHPGILGTAPSAEILQRWNRRESELVARHKDIGTEAVVAQLPNASNVHAGSADDGAKLRVAREGARTIPGRPENGGNCDIKDLSRGSRVYFPVHVPGANLSVGDLHFSQGDGEISFCGGIEMAGVITLHFNVIKSGMKKLTSTSPMYIPGPMEPNFGPSRYLTFEGFSVDHMGKQHFLDATVAYRQACLRTIEYFRRFGYSDYQIYLLLSAAPVQGHVAGLVDVPNACLTVSVPMDIFDFDVSPESTVNKLTIAPCAFTGGLANEVLQ